jgi:hypothetical protein
MLAFLKKKILPSQHSCARVHHVTRPAKQLEGHELPPQYPAALLRPLNEKAKDKADLSSSPDQVEYVNRCRPDMISGVCEVVLPLPTGRIITDLAIELKGTVSFSRYAKLPDMIG